MNPLIPKKGNKFGSVAKHSNCKSTTKGISKTQYFILRISVLHILVSLQVFSLTIRDEWYLLTF